MASADTARPTKRQLQGASSREEILDAASRLMSARGYDGTSMSELARESGLPSSSIYWHFSSKLGVLEAVMARGAERFFAEVPPRPPDEAGDPGTVIRATLAHASVSVQAHPEFLRLFILLLVGTDPTRQEHHEVVRAVRAAGSSRLHAMLRTAYAGHGPQTATAIADELVEFAQGMFDGAFLAVQHNPGLSHPQLMEQMSDALIGLGDQILARS